MSLLPSLKNPAVIHVASEAVPFAKTGGLADVVGALSAALGTSEHASSVVIPAYRSVRAKWLSKAKALGTVGVAPGKGRAEKMQVFKLERGENQTVYFIDHPGFFDRADIYGEGGGDYPDNARRFAFFAYAVLEAVRKEMLPAPDIFHVHDWQTALVPVYLKEHFKKDVRLKSIKTLLTLHNVAYQGVFDRSVLSEIGLGEHLFHFERMEYWGKINYLKGGMVYADRLNAVSPSYAEEIQTPYYGAGLDGVLRFRREALSGILNGIDTKIWNPETDTHIQRTFSASQLDCKAENKRDLQETLKLEINDRIPLAGFVGRLVDQKGLDIVFEAMEDMLKRSVQFIFLGVGDPAYHDRLTVLARKYSSRVAVKIGYDDEFAHRIYAGADMFLMPSRFEPCGLGQLIGFRYGTVPIVRKTGGLRDTVRDVEEDPTHGNGFVFIDYSGAALKEAVRRACRYYENQTAWPLIMKRIMGFDFSWKVSAEKYMQLYQTVTAASKTRAHSPQKNGTP